MGSWYRSPGSTSEEFQLFREQLDYIRTHHKGKKLPSVHVIGDFNFKDIDWLRRLSKSGSTLSQSEGQILIDILNYHGLEQMVYFPGVVLQEELESEQKRAARFVTGNYMYNYEIGSMTCILGQLKWESLKKRRKDNRLILLYKGLKGKASVPTDDLIPKTRRCRNQHSMAFQTPIANTDVYKGSFFPRTNRDWNALPDSLISFAEDAEDCVAKFTSLVRARD